MLVNHLASRLKLPAARLVDKTRRRAQLESLQSASGGLGGMRSLQHFHEIAGLESPGKVSITKQADEKNQNKSNSKNKGLGNQALYFFIHTVDQLNNKRQ